MFSRVVGKVRLCMRCCHEAVAAAANCLCVGIVPLRLSSRGDCACVRPMACCIFHV